MVFKEFSERERETKIKLAAYRVRGTFRLKEIAGAVTPYRAFEPHSRHAVHAHGQQCVGQPSSAMESQRLNIFLL